MELVRTSIVNSLAEHDQGCEMERDSLIAFIHQQFEIMGEAWIRDFHARFALFSGEYYDVMTTDGEGGFTGNVDALCELFTRDPLLTSTLVRAGTWIVLRAFLQAHLERMDSHPGYNPLYLDEDDSSQ